MTDVARTALGNTASSFSSKAALDNGFASNSYDTNFVPDIASGDRIDLSDHAKAILAQAEDSQSVSEDLKLTARERLAKRIDAFADKLNALLDKQSIPRSEKIKFTVNPFGDVQVDGAYKKKLEQYFKDDPEAAKELKTLTRLSALQATQQALDLYIQEKKAAKGDTKLEKAAEDRYHLRSSHIKELSGIITYEDGKLTSAAFEYIEAIATKQKSELN